MVDMNKLIQLFKWGMANPRKIIPYIVYKLRYNPRYLSYLRHRSESFRDFYAQVMQLRVQHDPMKAVGGMWKEIGELQFNFLIKQGLKPHHKLLDLGCGCLRGGLHFIRYLNQGNYCGLDISKEILEVGREFLVKEKLVHKKPTLQVNRDLKFEELVPKKFDYILAQSVFTHMPLNDIEECFQNVHKIMRPESVFFATFNDGGQECFTNPCGTGFYYAFQVLKRLGENHKLRVEEVEDFRHPRNQSILKITLR